jgi:carboxyl-terminal processing protease
MRGLIEALDPYSSYLSKEQLQQLEKRKATGTAGAGLVISKKGDVTYVLSVQRGGPAEAAGLRAGDYIIEIDGVTIEDKSILEVESMVRGTPDTTVNVTVFRNSRTKPAQYTLTRKADSEVPIVSRMAQAAAEGKQLNVGVLDVSSLSGSSLEQAKIKLKTIISAGAQSLILDLRDCADGPLSAGADLANFFLKDGVITYSKNRQGEKVQEIKADPEKFVSDLPLVILANGSTAGAAEIAAGALKDLNRATLVGEKTFGSGSAQTQIMLKSGSMLILSTSKYYTPSGKLIQDDTARNAGIKPDIQSPDDDHRQELLVDAYYDEVQDDSAKYKQLQEKIDKEQMEKALETVAKASNSLKKAA